MMYRVTWVIDIEAENALDAACYARDIQLDPNNTATVFDVSNSSGEVAAIDLGE